MLEYYSLQWVRINRQHCAGTIIESTSISIKTLFTILFIYLSVRFPIKSNKQNTFQGEERVYFKPSMRFFLMEISLELLSKPPSPYWKFWTNIYLVVWVSLDPSHPCFGRFPKYQSFFFLKASLSCWSIEDRVNWKWTRSYWTQTMSLWRSDVSPSLLTLESACGAHYPKGCPLGFSQCAMWSRDCSKMLLSCVTLLTLFVLTADASSNCSYSPHNDRLHCTISSLQAIKSVTQSAHSSGNC